MKVSIIIVNWNGKHYLDTCLSSILNQTIRDFEIIMVDNASTDGSVDYLKEKYPFIKIIQTNQNLGFAKGCNVGIRESKADYIVALSNDTKVEKNWLEELIKVADSDKNIGICGSKLLLMDKPNIYNSAGQYIFFNAFIYDRGPGKKVGKYEKLERVDGVCAASALFRREMLDQIGFLDERFFFGHDDVDLCWRAKNAGWKTMYVPSSVCYHKMLGSVKGKKLHDQFVIDAAWVISKNSNILGLINITSYFFVAMIKAITWKSFGKNKDYRPFYRAIKSIPHLWKMGKIYRQSRKQ
jgi:GT2 family glycosyltransferase